MKSVALVLDAHFYGNLKRIAETMPVWIVSSPQNDLAVENTREALGDCADVTRLFAIPGEDAAATFERALYDIDEHHGPCSSSSPYEQVLLIGRHPAVPSKDVLDEIGLEPVSGDSQHFTLRRRNATNQR